MILSGLICLTLLSIYPVVALEDENLLENSPVTEKHYQTSDYGAAYVHFKETFSLTGVSIGMSGKGASIGISFSWNKSADLEWKNVYPQSSYI